MATTKNTDDEIIELLNSDTIPEVKIRGLQYILGLTGSEEGIQHLLCEKYFLCLCGLVEVNDINVVDLALKCLINLSGEDLFFDLLQSTENNLLQNVTQMIYSSSVKLNTNAFMFLMNVTRFNTVSKLVLDSLMLHGGIKKYIELLNSGKPESNYHLMGPILCNLTSLPEARKMLLGEDKLIKNLLAYTTYEHDELRKLGIVGTIRNCCFETEYHQLLLGDEIDILPALLLPIAGPEEFDEDDNEKLPLELQYLDDSKTRDPNPKVRLRLIEALNQLCATKIGRNVLKEKQAYLILRELHKWEKNRKVVVACENVVDILIGDDPPEELENFQEIEIPDDLVKKFEKIDEDLLNLDLD